MDFQVMMLEGAVSGEPQISMDEWGRSVCNFLVTQKQRTKSGNEWTHYYYVSAWGNLATKCYRGVRDGTRVLVTGKASASGALDANGKPVGRLDVSARNVMFEGAE